MRVCCCADVRAEYGDALAPVDKMRLFMAYLATHPEKLDPVKKQQWAKLARLDVQDMDTVCNMAYLNVAVMKQPGSQVGAGRGSCATPVACWLSWTQHLREGNRPYKPPLLQGRTEQVPPSLLA